MVHSAIFVLAFTALSGSVHAARQTYDVRKIIDAFRTPQDNLTILCAHRGLKWNHTTENSKESYFRASEAGIECIETDIHISRDGYLPMLHDAGLGRVTDVGERFEKPAYNPFTGQGYNPDVKGSFFKGFMEFLQLRDEAGRVDRETVITLPEMVQDIHDTGMNVVLQLDFKDKDAVEPAYWSLQTLTNAAGIPANEWCIYKLQATWWKTPEEFEAQAWVQHAFQHGVRLAYIPVFNPSDVDSFDTISSLREFAKTNYTISAEIELKSTGGALQDLQSYMLDKNASVGRTFNSSGTFFAIGDFVNTTGYGHFFNTSTFNLPADIRVNNTVYRFRNNAKPQTIDSESDTIKYSTDGHDHRSDFNWIIQSGYNWVITDTADIWHDTLKTQGRRNITALLADGEEVANEALSKDWYRRHARDLRV